MFALKKNVTVFVPDGIEKNSTLGYAAEELQRILSLGNFELNVKLSGNSDGLWIGEEFDIEISDVKFDGFVLSVKENALGIAAPTEKGILNGVYELAERFGFRFLTALPDGELVPETFAGLKEGNFICNPRFPYRGIILSINHFTSEESVTFFAKLKYNTVCFHDVPAADAELCRKLGLRREIGGHGFSKLLDRKLFEDHPDYFRMFQPDDFRGKRQPDSNLCVTNPEVRKIVVENFRRVLREEPDFHARLAWADDLPASGWCWCSSCRSYSPSAQNMLGMKLLCKAADLENSNQRISLIAYHDTLFPDPDLTPDKRMFFHWAPRERCYAHAIDDPDCPRNAKHWEALNAWKKKFAGIDDSHTFEYYLDQLLFNGLHPFTPEIIAADMKAYHRAGFEVNMTLQVVACDIIPDYNQQFFARANWHEELDEANFLEWLTDDPAFREFQHVRAKVFKEVLAMCGHDFNIYLDYRFLPETNTEFARKMVGVYAENSQMLTDAAKKLSANLPAGMWRKFAEQNIRQAEFESAELMCMHYQQAEGCKLADARLNESESAISEACEFFKKHLDAIDNAEQLCLAAGYPETWWHLTVRIPFERRETKYKLEKYSQ